MGPVWRLIKGQKDMCHRCGKEIVEFPAVPDSRKYSELPEPISTLALPKVALLVTVVPACDPFTSVICACSAFDVPRNSIVALKQFTPMVMSEVPPLELPLKITCP